MAKKLDDIFNECYERIRSGESLESCLRSYAQYRAQLEPLLRTTFDIGRRVSYIQPRPAFKHWARVRIESAQRYPRQPVRTETPAASVWWRHGWAVAVSIGIILLLTTGSTMAASSQALPTEPLYPVKLATEQVRLAVAVSDVNKAIVQTELVQERADELEAIAYSGNTGEVVEAAERYDEQWAKASAAIAKIEGTQPAPSYVPPAVTTPTTTTPATSTPPSVTATTENATSPTTTTPTATTPSENATSPSTTTAPATTAPTATTPSENATSPSTTTAPATTTPTATTPSENATAPSTTTAPATTTPSATETPSPPADTTDKGKSSKTHDLRKSLDKSTSKSLSALQDAKGKSSERAKEDLQKAIDKINKSHQSHDTTSQSGNTKGKQWSKPTGGTNKTAVQSDNRTTSGTHSHNQPSTSNTVNNHR